MSADKIQIIIEGSGNNFHSKVVSFLRSKGWTVLISPYYSDIISEKLREIDIIAEKAFFIGGIGAINATLNVQLFIECKYIPKEIVFWFDNKDQHQAEELITRTTPLEPFQKNITIEQHHYYQSTEIAKLFASSPEKMNENEVIYKALNQSLNALIYYKNKSSIITDPKASPIEFMVQYPIILLNNFDKIYKVKMDGGTYSNVAENFQLDVNYVYFNEKRENINEYFILDIVDFNLLSQYLDNLEKQDVAILKEALAWSRRAPIQESEEYDPYSLV